MKTTIYLDVDGVLNALGDIVQNNGGWSAWPQKRVVPELANGWQNGRGFNITYAPEMLEELTAIAAREHAEIRWLTTWTHDAAGVLSRDIEFSAGADFKVVTVPSDLTSPSYLWWKLFAISHDWDGESAVVWIDDDLRNEPEARRWLDGLDVPTLGVLSNPRTGLTRDDVRNIVEFVDDTGTLV